MRGGKSKIDIVKVFCKFKQHKNVGILILIMIMQTPLLAYIILLLSRQNYLSLQCKIQKDCKCFLKI